MQLKMHINQFILKFLIIRILLILMSNNYYYIYYLVK